MALTPEDRALIGDLVVAYAYAIDERNWQAFEALFTPDARIDYESAGGIAGSPAQVAAWMPQALSLFTWTLHSAFTHRLQPTGPDTVNGAIHMLARHGVVFDGTSEVMDVSGVYYDEYVRTQAGWRFASRREHTLSITGGRFAEMVAARARK
ncbi:MAG: nuclear transport factor 2 family protein [Deltaproteobacteria bacterium]|nr:nuclear transport factor 2 family protein [Deltaproteobacteria bacterium]